MKTLLSVTDPKMIDLKNEIASVWGKCRVSKKFHHGDFRELAMQARKLERQYDLLTNPDAEQPVNSPVELVSDGTTKIYSQIVTNNVLLTYVNDTNTTLAFEEMWAVQGKKAERPAMDYGWIAEGKYGRIMIYFDDNMEIRYDITLFTAYHESTNEYQKALIARFYKAIEVFKHTVNQHFLPAIKEQRAAKVGA